MLLGSYIRIKIENKNTGNFINKCKKSGIALYNVKSCPDGCYFNVKAGDYKSALSVAEKNKIDLAICGRLGLAMKLIIYKSRKAFFLIVVLLALFYGINSCFISEITIDGNNTFADKQILDCLNSNGLYVGRLKFGINPELLQNEVIKDFPELSWIWLKIDGTKAIVDVREKISEPDFFDYNDYGNMVASKDGVIKSAIASGGTLLVSEGVFVKKGDILISGVYDSTENAPVRFINADGKVYATTTYSAQDTFSCNYISYKPKNKLQTKLTLSIFNTQMWQNNINSEGSLILPAEKIKYRIFGKNYFPLAFTKTKYCEIIKTEYALSQAKAQELAFDEMLKKLNLSLPGDAEVIDTKKEITQNFDGTFKLSVTLICVENIAVKQSILVENQPEVEIGKST